MPAVAAAGLLFVAAVDPGEPGNYPTCPWLWLTGTYCPGCGTLRMLHALSHGDVATAVAMNPFALLMGVVLAVVWVRWVRQSWSGGVAVTSLPQWSAGVYLAVALAYWVARNLPAMAWLAPG